MILDPKGNEIPIEDFVKSYENGESGLKLSSFFKTPRSVAIAKSVNLTKQDPKVGGINEDITTHEPKHEEKTATPPKVAEVAVRKEDQEDQPVKFLKCPYCNFQNIHQESIDHHMRLKHGTG